MAFWDMSVYLECRLPPRSRWELCFSGLLRSEEW